MFNYPTIILAFAGLVVANTVTDQSRQQAEKLWLGKWESTDRQENFAEFMKAIGLDLDLNAKIYNIFTKEGDHYRHIWTVPSKNYKFEINFKLDEEGKTKMNQTDVTFKFTEIQNQLHAEYVVPSKNNMKVIEDYKITGDELVKSYKVGDVQAKRWYKKVK